MGKRKGYKTTTIARAKAAVSKFRSAKKNVSRQAELNPKQVLSVRCPTCGAAPGKQCELSTGQPRTDPHRDRRVIAKDSRT